MSLLKFEADFIKQFGTEHIVCPYCGKDQPKDSADQAGCCGESSAHFVKEWRTKDRIYNEKSGIAFL